jgi:dTDP-4-amino-4,6-dideoxygalactose transaminase
MLPINDLRRHIANVRPAVDDALARVTASGWFVMGPELASFESEFAAYCGVGDAVGVANGTDALELALRAVGVGPGDDVVTVANAGGYASAAIASIGASPVYVDVEPASLLVSRDSLSRAIARDPRALVVTHLYGRMPDMEALAQMLAGTRVAIVEDCAQAHGAERHGRKAGSFGAAGCFSFYPTKNLGALGDGGIVVTRDRGVAERVRELRQYGWSKKYVRHAPNGRNSRLDEMQAAALRVLLPYLPAWNRRRREIAARYTSALRHPHIQPAAAGGSEYVAHLYVVQSPDRDGLAAHLGPCGIGTDIHYPIPDHRQAGAGGHADVVLPETELAATRILTLPCFPEMTDEEVESVVAACNAWNG